MYCPECRAEYREGFSKCSDCAVLLVAERPPKPKGPGDPHLESVPVLESSDRIVMAAAKGLLEEAGIPYYIAGDEISVRPGMADALIFRPYRVQVARDRETEALEILRPLDEART